MFEELFSERGLSLERLRSFLEVAEAGGIARAAKDDAVRQSQFSRQISELEQFFGLALTERRGKHLSLNEHGRKLAAVVREQFAGLRDFHCECRDQPVRYTIGAGDSILQWLVLPMMGTWMKGVPNSRLCLSNLRSDQIVESLLHARLDFGIVRQGTPVEPLKQVSIGPLPYALFVPEALVPKAKRDDVSWMLKRLQWTTLASDASFLQRVTDAAAKHELSFEVILEAESFPQAARAVATGAFAGVLPLAARSDFKGQKMLVIEAPFLKTVERKLALVWHPRLLRIRPHAKAAAEWLGRNLREALRAAHA
jgi:DNA-binding transcriptional LysR family regulator